MTTHQDVGKHKRKRGRPKCLKVNNAHQTIIPVLPKTTIQTSPIVVSTLPPQVVQIIDHSGNLVSLQQNKAMGHPNIINLAVPVTTVGSLLLPGSNNQDNMIGGMVMNSTQPVATATTTAGPIIIINKPVSETLSVKSTAPISSVGSSEESKCSLNSVGSSADKGEQQKGQSKRDREVHNAEEKRRKAKINSWITKLGSLLSKFPTEKQNKTSILERAFEYINQKEGKGPQIPCEPKRLLLRIKNLESVVIMLVDLLKRHSVPIPDNVQIIKVASKPNETNPAADTQNTDKTIINDNFVGNSDSCAVNTSSTNKIIVELNTSHLPVEKDTSLTNIVSSAVCTADTSLVTCSDTMCSAVTNPIDKKQVDLPVVVSSSAVKDIQHVVKLPSLCPSSVLQASTMNKPCDNVVQNLLPSSLSGSLLLQNSMKNIPELVDQPNVPLIYIPVTNTLTSSNNNMKMCQNITSAKIEMKNSLWRPISSLIPPVCVSTKENSPVSNTVSSISLDPTDQFSLQKVVEPCVSIPFETKKQQPLLDECGNTGQIDAGNSATNVVYNQKGLFIDMNSTNKIPLSKIIIIESDIPGSNVQSSTVFSLASSLTATISSLPSLSLTSPSLSTMKVLPSSAPLSSSLTSLSSSSSVVTSSNTILSTPMAVSSPALTLYSTVGPSLSSSPTSLTSSCTGVSPSSLSSYPLAPLSSTMPSLSSLTSLCPFSLLSSLPTLASLSTSSCLSSSSSLLSTTLSSSSSSSSHTSPAVVATATAATTAEAVAVATAATAATTTADAAAAAAKVEVAAATTSLSLPSLSLLSSSFTLSSSSVTLSPVMVTGTSMLASLTLPTVSSLPLTSTMETSSSVNNIASGGSHVVNNSLNVACSPTDLVNNSSKPTMKNSKKSKSSDIEKQSIVLEVSKLEKLQDVGEDASDKQGDSLKENIMNRKLVKKSLEKRINSKLKNHASKVNSKDTPTSNLNNTDNLSKNQLIVSTNDMTLQGFGIDNLLIINSIPSNKHSLLTDSNVQVEPGDIEKIPAAILSTPKRKYNSMNNTFSPIKTDSSRNGRSRISSTGHTVASLLETTCSLSEFEVQIKRNVNPHCTTSKSDVVLDDVSSKSSKTVAGTSIKSSNNATCNSTSKVTLNDTTSTNKNCTLVVSSSSHPLNTVTSQSPISVSSSNSTSLASNVCRYTTVIPYSFESSTNVSSSSNTNSTIICSRTFSSDKSSLTNLVSSNCAASSINNCLEAMESKCLVTSCDVMTPTSLQTSNRSMKRTISSAVSSPVSTNLSQQSTAKQVTSTSSSYSTKRWGNVLENAHNSDMLLSCFTLGNRKRPRTKKVGRSSKKNSTNEASQSSVSSSNSSELSITTCSSNSNSCLKTCQVNVVTGMESVSSNSHGYSSNITTSLPTYSEAIGLNVYPLTNKNSSIVTSANDSSYNCVSSNKRSSDLLTTISECKWIIKSSVSLAQKPTSENSPVVSSSEDISGNTCMNLSSVSNNSMHNMTSISVCTNSSPSNYSVPLRIKSGIVRTMKDRTIRNKWLEMEQGKNNEAALATTNDQQVDQCASPVISFPNQGNRKRSMPSVSSEREAKRLPQCSVDSDENSSRIFSAESLCQSANHREDELKTCKSNTKNSNVDIQKNNSPQQKLEQPIQKLKHQPDLSYSNSLPTILNIFAPAPVPVSSSNQSNLSTGISNFSAESLVNNECNVNIVGNNMTDSTFQDTMLMSANPQLFTNFSADTLLSDNENAAYADENIITQNNVNQMSQYWNNSWLSQEMPLNDPVFPNPSNMQNNIQRQQRNNLQASTECSPIKSIMSILQSTPNNNQNLNFDSFNDNTMNNVMLPHAMINRLPHRSRRLDNQLNVHANLSNNTSQWSKNHSSNISQTGNKGFCNEAMIPSWNNHGGVNHRSGSREQIQLNNMNSTNTNTRIAYQNSASKMDIRNKKETNGPMFGNYPLVSSGGS